MTMAEGVLHSLGLIVASKVGNHHARAALLLKLSREQQLDVISRTFHEKM